MATQQQKNASELGEQAIALAEQLGRIAGTIEGTAEDWLNRQSLAEQLMRVRDGASQMLENLTDGIATGRKAVTGNVGNLSQNIRRQTSQAWSAINEGRAAARKNQKKKKTVRASAAATRRADPAHAPGKRHRKPTPTRRGVKKSDESIPKLRTAHAVRQRRKSYA